MKGNPKNLRNLTAPKNLQPTNDTNSQNIFRQFFEVLKKLLNSQNSCFILKNLTKMSKSFEQLEKNFKFPKVLTTVNLPCVPEPQNANVREIRKRKRETEKPFFPPQFFLFIIFWLWYPGPGGLFVCFQFVLNGLVRISSY